MRALTRAAALLAVFLCTAVAYNSSTSEYTPYMYTSAYLSMSTTEPVFPPPPPPPSLYSSSPPPPPPPRPCELTHNCDPDNGRCVDDPDSDEMEGAYTPYVCVCESGFVGDGMDCTDVDECATLTHACPPEKACTNTFSSFSCSCPPGLVDTSEGCEDINECLSGSHTCATEACFNTHGSYVCGCPPGQVKVNGNCVNADECASGNNNCDTHAVCTDTSGSFNCECGAGWYGSGVECANANECTTGTHVCSVNAVCTDTVGSYECACVAGYVGDGIDCHTNECVTGAFACNTTTSVCVYANDTYTCECLPGFTTSVTGECVNIDECAVWDRTEKGVRNTFCDDNAVCVDTLGSFECVCDSGFLGSALGECFDTDECISGTHSCGVNADCVNTAGSYTCVCASGYAVLGSGADCVNIDECAGVGGDLLCGEHAYCVDSAGSFGCVCEDGYTVVGDVCVDIDECAEGTHTCGDVGSTSTLTQCVNVAGGYECTCAAGTVLVNGVCEDVDECSNADSASACGDESECENTHGSFDCVAAVVSSGGNNAVSDAPLTSSAPFIAVSTAGGAITLILIGLVAALIYRMNRAKKVVPLSSASRGYEAAEVWAESVPLDQVSGKIRESAHLRSLATTSAVPSNEVDPTRVVGREEAQSPTLTTQTSTSLSGYGLVESPEGGLQQPPRPAAVPPLTNIPRPPTYATRAGAEYEWEEPLALESLTNESEWATPGYAMSWHSSMLEELDERDAY